MIQRLQLEQIKYTNAKTQGNWHSLVAYPFLLFKWQYETLHRHNLKDVKDIATIASHQLKHHNWCEDKCKRIDSFMRKQMIKDLLGVLNKKIAETDQLAMI